MTDPRCRRVTRRGRWGPREPEAWLLLLDGRERSSGGPPFLVEGRRLLVNSKMRKHVGRRFLPGRWSSHGRVV
ncbi:hypothetical protein EJB05_00190, partial [Eragrostis curvula]